MGARRHHHPGVEVLIDLVGLQSRLARRITASWRQAKAITPLVLLGGVAACASAAPVTLGPTDTSTGVPDGGVTASTRAVYTSAQAERGERVFSTVCSACHGGSQFTGPIFELTWMADPLGHLFEHISMTMPQDRPGSLSNEEYAAILAYFLQVNGREAGDLELPADVELLNTIRW